MGGGVGGGGAARTSSSSSGCNSLTTSVQGSSQFSFANNNNDGADVDVLSSLILVPAPALSRRFDAADAADAASTTSDRRSSSSSSLLFQRRSRDLRFPFVASHSSSASNNMWRSAGDGDERRPSSPSFLAAASSYSSIAFVVGLLLISFVASVAASPSKSLSSELNLMK